MKLVLRTLDNTSLQLELDDVVNPLSKKLTLNSEQIQELKNLCANYQEVLNRQSNTDLLNTIGFQLFELLNKPHADLITKWLNGGDRRQLEIHTTPTPNPLQQILLSLPWEVMTSGNKFLAEDTILFEVTRRVGDAKPTPRTRYKDLTLAFMAADPGFTSGLNYEDEERAILKITSETRNLNLWVEESGNLSTLTQRIVDSGHCDMVHISCHGQYDKNLEQVTLQLENKHYGLQPAVANDFHGLAQHIQCLFLSACHSAEVTDTSSFALELAKTGIANIIGWDGSVADDDAITFAAEVYQVLMQQASVPFACAFARQKLLLEHLRTGKHPHWHLGRVYLTPNGGLQLIDSTQSPSPKRRGKSFHDLLDRKKKVVPVASKETFVGRKQETRQAHSTFHQNTDAGVLLTGIGGTGKSSLAARIVQRMEPQYKAAIIYQDYSEAAILGELKQFISSGSTNEDFQRYLNDIRQNPDIFADNLEEILQEHLSEEPIILVVDDLEQHALEDLAETPADDDKVPVKSQYQNALRGVIEAFTWADTASCLIITSRYRFHLTDKNGQDVTDALHEIKVPDMNRLEQRKHWLALLQSGVVSGERDKQQDQGFLEQIWAICQGNPGLQDVLYQPLLRGEYRALQTALDQLNNYNASQSSDNATVKTGKVVDKYLQRIALEAYHAALTDTERQCLRVLSLFDFAVPEQVIIQAGPELGIEDTQSALQRLDNFGLLTYWQGEGLEGHISCYGLAQKIVESLSKDDRHFISKVCAPLLWHIWFNDFLQEYRIPRTQSLSESVTTIFNNHFPQKYEGELPLQSYQDQERLAYLHCFCIANSLADWEELGFDANEFIDLLELSLSLHTFEKLRVSAGAVNGLSAFQWSELHKIFSEERGKFKELSKDHPQDIIILLLRQFGGRPQLLTKGYRINFGELSDDDKQLIDSIEIQNAEDRYLVGIKLAKTESQKADVYDKYAYFLADQKQDYEKAEAMYLRAIEADPKHAGWIGNYAQFLADQKQDYEKAETMYLRAIEVNPQQANNLVNYALFLQHQKQDYEKAEIMYLRAIEADSNSANKLGNYAYFLAGQKQDYEKAEAMYLRAIEADPKHAGWIGNYAQFLADQKQDYEKAEIMYLRAVEADPNDVRWIGNYAQFLRNQKQDYEKAETMYLRAIEVNPQQANNLVNYALFLQHQKQDYEKAETMYLRAIEVNPQQANNLVNYALFLQHQKQDYEKAEAMYLRAIEADPKHAGWIGNYAQFLADQKQDYEKAETMYLRAIEVNPQQANNLVNYALFLQHQKQDYEKAEAMYLRAIEADPKHAGWIGNYAQFLADQKQDYEKAEIMYLRAVEADPNDVRWIGNYAQFLRNQKQDYEKAETMYLRAIEVNPQQANNLVNYALFLQHQKQDYEKAEIMYLRAIEADPKHAYCLVNYALFLQHQKQDYEQAEAMYLRAIEADPNDVRWIGNYAQFLRNQKQDYEKAETMYLRAIEVNPQQANNLVNYALFLQHQKQDYEQAEAMYLRAIEADPKRADWIGNYAYFLANQKQDYEKAEAMYLRAIEADPKHADWIGNYAYFLANQKQDYEKAEAMYLRAIEADPKHADWIGNYALFLKNQKQDYAKAETMYLRAIEADPKHANCLGNYAKLLFISGQNEKALKHLEQAESLPDLHPDLKLELAFYRYAHCSPYDLAPVKQQLESGSRSIDWNLSDNVKRAQEDNHSHPELLAAIAKVISGEQEIETLNSHPEWNQIP